MALDALLVALLLLLGLQGLASGAISQLAHWAGLGFAYLAARPLAARLTPLLAPALGFSPIGVRVLLSLVCFSVLYAGGTLIVHWALKKLAGNWEKGRLDRSAGFVLGVGKAAAVAFVLLSVALFFEKPLAGAFGKPPESVQRSFLIGLVRKHNLFEAISFPALARIERLLEAARGAHPGDALSDDPKLRELLSDPSLQAALKDETVARALRSGDWSALLNNPEIASLLKDSRIAEPETGR